MILTTENFSEFACGEGKAAIIASFAGQVIYPGAIETGNLLASGDVNFENGFQASTGFISCGKDGALIARSLAFPNTLGNADAGKSSIFVDTDTSLLSFKLADGSVVSIQ